MGLQSFTHFQTRLLGDFNALKRNRVGRGIGRRAAGRIATLCVVVVMLGFASGCRSSDPFSAWSDAELAEAARSVDEAEGWLEATGRRAAFETMAAADGEAPQQAGDAWFVSRAVAGSWTVRAAMAEVDRRRAAVAVAEGLADPHASVTVGELAETAAGQVDAIFAARQAFPFPGTLRARGRVAQAAVETARRALAERLSAVRADARRAYWSYQEAAAAMGILEQSDGLLRQIESAVRSRVEFGEAGQDDLLRVSRRRLRVGNEIDEARRRREAAAARLRELMSMEPDATLPDPTAATWARPAMDRAAVMRRAERDSPAVLVARGEVDRQRERLKLARIERRPDFTVGAIYAPVGEDGLAASANGEDQVAGVLGVTIPLWQAKHDAAEREAALGIGRAIAEIRAAQASATAKASDALARLASKQAVLDRLRERLLPEGRQTIDIALAGYRTGRLDVLQLLEDWRALLDDRLAEARVIAELQRARADLAEVLGGPIAGPRGGVQSNDEPNAHEPSHD